MLLLAASYYAYMSWSPQLVVLILFTTSTSYLAALGLQRAAGRPAARRLILAGGVVCSLACLFFFKYFNFFSQNVAAVLRAVSLPVSEVTLRVVLPVGISFYTFQTLGYLLDVYRGKLAAERHFGIYALYVSFFPQLVAGPIERAGSLLPQFYETHRFSTAQCSEGLRLILLGLFKKIVLADFVAPYVDAVYNQAGAYAGLPVLAATGLFALQICCDFSGYSDIALGSARLLGFRLMENFRSPYFSRSLREFWRRWHISLSSWFADYVYIPLGGSRLGRGWHMMNLMLTFLLSGLWHGANWTFLLWGALHGACLCAEALLRPRRERRLAACTARWQRRGLSLWRWAATLAVVLVGWVFFRANSLQDLGWLLGHLLPGLQQLRHPLAAFVEMGLTPAVLLQMAALAGLLALWDWHGREGRVWQWFTALRPVLRYAVYYGAAFLLLLRLMTTPDGDTAEFLYFQF